MLNLPLIYNQPNNQPDIFSLNTFTNAGQVNAVAAGEEHMQIRALSPSACPSMDHRSRNRFLHRSVLRVPSTIENASSSATKWIPPPLMFKVSIGSSAVSIMD